MLCLADKPRNGRVAVGETIVNSVVLDDSLLNPRRYYDCWDTKICMREICKKNCNAFKWRRTGLQVG